MGELVSQKVQQILVVMVQLKLAKMALGVHVSRLVLLAKQNHIILAKTMFAL
jgi:hypothetical protein